MTPRSWSDAGYSVSYPVMEACQSVDVGGVAGKLGDAEASSCESDSFEKIVQPDYEQVCPPVEEQRPQAGQMAAILPKLRRETAAPR